VLKTLRFDGGYLAPYFVTDPERMECVYENAYVLVCEKISSTKALLPTLEGVAKSGQPLLIIAEEVEGEALATLVVNKIRGTLKVVAVKAGEFEDRRIIAEELRIAPESVALNDLGRARRVIVDERSTTIEFSLESKI